jgi:hypothetical protein
VNRIYVLQVSVTRQLAITLLCWAMADVCTLGIINEPRVTVRIAMIVVAVVLFLLGLGAFINGVRIIIARFMITFGFRR